MTSEGTPDAQPPSGWFEPAGAGAGRYCLLATALGVVLPAAAAIGVVAWSRLDGAPRSWTGDLLIALLAVAAAVVVAIAAQWAWRWTALPEPGLVEFLPQRWMRRRRARHKAHKLLRALDAHVGPSPEATRLLIKLATVLASVDRYERGRPERRAKLVAEVARQLGFGAEELRQAELASRLQDLGQAPIPVAILHQRGPLSPAEADRIRQHPATSAALIAPWVDAEVAAAVSAHHEHVDGSGYPEGLSGQEIPPPAALLAAVDTYDALIHDRPYRRRVPPADAAVELRNVVDTSLADGPVQALIAVEGSRNHLARSVWGWASAPVHRVEQAVQDSALALTAGVAVLLVGLAAWAGLLSAGSATVALVSPSPSPTPSSPAPSPVPSLEQVQVVVPSPASPTQTAAAMPSGSPAGPSLRDGALLQAATKAHPATKASAASSAPQPSAAKTSPASSPLSAPAAQAGPLPSASPTRSTLSPRPRRSRSPSPPPTHSPSASPTPQPTGSPSPSPSPGPSPTAAKPVISGLSPATGPSAGGTSVTIAGSGFTGATAVDFGTGPAATFTVDSSGAITATSPPGAGIVTVKVVTPAGASGIVLAAIFQYRG